MSNIGKRITEAREARALNKTQLARKLSVTSEAVSAWEGGRYAPDIGHLSKLSRILRIPPNFFSMRVNQEQRMTVFYRKLSAATKRNRLALRRKITWVCRLLSFVEHYIDLPEVNLPGQSELGIPSDPAKLDREAIFDIARKTRQFYGFGDGPISNTIRLLENMGIIVLTPSFDDQTIDAFVSRPNSSRPIVLLNSWSASAVRLRFDIAHELAHLILHRHLDQVTIQTSELHKQIEKQAHLFAGAFLMPEASFLEECFPVTLRVMKQIKPHWRVSIAAMIMRLQALGVIGKDKGQYFFREMARQKIRNPEPLDDEIESEVPQLLPRSLDILSQNHLLTANTCQMQIGVFPEDIADVTGLSVSQLGQQEETNLRLRSNVIHFPGAKKGLGHFGVMKP